MKVLVLDSGILINLAMNGLIYIIPELKKKTGVRFVITSDVKYETVDRPSGIPRFELEALTIKELIARKEVEMPADFKISESEIKSRRDKLMDLANHSLQANGKWLQIVSNGEISCLALSEIFTEKGIENIIGIDERTTRLLSEKPENLENLMSSRLHQRITSNKKQFTEFKKFRFIRSTEIVYVAVKKNVLSVKDPRALEAALYATKFKGAAVSYEEIDVLKKM